MAYLGEVGPVLGEEIRRDIIMRADEAGAETLLGATNAGRDALGSCIGQSQKYTKNFKGLYLSFTKNNGRIFGRFGAVHLMNTYFRSRTRASVSCLFLFGDNSGVNSDDNKWILRIRMFPYEMEITTSKSGLRER